MSFQPFPVPAWGTSASHALALTYSGSLSGTAGTPYTLTLIANGGLAPYTYSETGTLPNGLTLNSSTGVLSGTPTNNGSFPITFTVTDAKSAVANLPLTLTIAVDAYVGPGDVVSGASFWWGLRGYNAAYAAGSNKAINVRRDSDNATRDIVILPTGALDVATATTFAASANLFVTKLYDQTGNGNDISQATAAAQPKLIFNFIGSLPGIQLNGSMYMTVTRGADIGIPVTMVNVAERTGGTGAVTYLFVYLGPSSHYIDGGWESAANTSFIAEFGQANQDLTAADNAPHVFQHLYNFVSSAIAVDATNRTGIDFPGQYGAFASTVLFAGNTSGGSAMTGNWTEGGLWPIAFSSPNNTNMYANAHTYWGF